MGRTTIAANLAIAIRSLTEKKVALVDCSLLFGDIGIMLNLPATKTISDLIANVNALDQDLLEGVLVSHSSGVKVLLAPTRPELAELITGEHVRKILTILKTLYDYVIVDTRPSFDDAILSALDVSDRILVVTSLEMSAIKNIKLFLEVAEALHYSHDKLWLTLNRTDSTSGIGVADIEESIRFTISADIVGASQLMTAAANQGVPVVVSHRDSPVAKSIFDLATKVLTEADAAGARERASTSAVAGREGKSGMGLGKLRLLSFASKKGNV